jgi:broad specificity phosphatase PhoE
MNLLLIRHGESVGNAEDGCKASPIRCSTSAHEQARSGSREARAERQRFVPVT